MIVNLIAAYARGNRGIGSEGRIPWRLPADLARFRRLTLGHTLIMGRRTYEALGGRKLDGRRLLVLSRTPAQGSDDDYLQFCNSVEDGLRLAAEEHGDGHPFIAGGGQIYAAALARDVVDRMELTIVEAAPVADAFFPQFAESDWTEIESSFRAADERNAHDMTFRTLLRNR